MQLYRSFPPDDPTASGWISACLGISNPISKTCIRADQGIFNWSVSTTEHQPKLNPLFYVSCHTGVFICEAFMQQRNECNRCQLSVSRPLHWAPCVYVASDIFSALNIRGQLICRWVTLFHSLIPFYSLITLMYLKCALCSCIIKENNKTSIGLGIVIGRYSILNDSDRDGRQKNCVG